MMKSRYTKACAGLLLLMTSVAVHSGMAQLETPLEASGFAQLSSHQQLVKFVNDAAAASSNVSVEGIGASVQGREIPAVKISSGTFGANPDKVKVLFFAQLHGNEQSGKEGALMLVRALANGQLDRFLGDMDLIVVPQVNPDGSERNDRRNANNVDLNRNLLVLEEVEGRAIHDLFKRYLPEVSVDIHEYFPYRANWRRFGYEKHYDMQIGLVTNPNIHPAITASQNDDFLPFIERYLNERTYSFHNYYVGDVPEIGRVRDGLLEMDGSTPVVNVTRHSNVGMYDGRQSFGILNTYALIYEGKNGRDRFADNIERRAKSQYDAMVGLLEFIQANKASIMGMVKEGRERLVNAREGELVAVRLALAKSEAPLQLPLRSVATGEVTVIEVDEYYPNVVPVMDVARPAGYLVPRADRALVDWMRRHQVVFTGEYSTAGMAAHRYTQARTAADIRKERLPQVPPTEDYYFVPINQLHSNMLVLALEPQSQVSLADADSFKYLLRGRHYPILRLESL